MGITTHQPTDSRMDDEALLVKLRFILQCNPAAIHLEYPAAVQLWRIIDSPLVPHPPEQPHMRITPKRLRELLEIAEEKVFGESRAKVFAIPIY